MIQLFRERSFGDIFGDTFAFFRQNGRHFFKTYITINGGLLLLIAVLSYVLFDVFKGTSSDHWANSSPNTADAVFAENSGLVIGASILLFITFQLAALINYSFPVIYLSLYETRESNFTVSDMFRKLLSRTGKIFFFFFASIFVVTPVVVIIFGINMLLVFVLIGIPLFLIVLPAVINWVSLSFYEYINTDSGYIDALSGAFRYLMENFWKFVGSTLLFVFMIQAVLGVLTMVPYTIAIGMVVTNGTAMEANGTTLMLIIVVFLVGTTILSLLLTNFLLIAQGMMFYSCKEAENNISTSSEIDNIGLHFE